VLLADDHAGILTRLEHMLAPDCEVVGCFTSSVGLLEAAKQLKPDVIVLDVNMPEIDGLESCSQITEMSPQTKVVLITATNEAAIMEEAFSLGATAFVPKHLVGELLLPAIQRACLPPG
jgi:two-component system, LytTR family, response regulator